MSEWWTYRLSDFLMFSASTYYRLFERYNAALWPWHGLVLALGLGLVVHVVRSPQAQAGPAARLACVVFGAGWIWMAWAFHWQRYASINSAAPAYAAAFAVQGLMLAGLATDWPHMRTHLSLANLARGPGARTGLGLLLFALLVQPAVGALFGRPWSQAEVFGLAPDPSVIGTLGLLLLLRRTDRHGVSDGWLASWAWLLWPIPLLWCLLSGATLWTMGSPDALLLPAAAGLALWAAWGDHLQRVRAEQNPDRS